MGRYLRLAILIAGLWVCAAVTMADNPAASAPSAPAATTATHALDAATAAQPAAAQATGTAPVATTAMSVPAASTAPASTSAAMPAPARSGPSLPTRGMNMANVEHIFGTPQEKLPAVPDPGSKLHPPITRWIYPDYVVYFEYNYVVHTVLKKHPFADRGHRGN